MAQAPQAVPGPTRIARVALAHDFESQPRIADFSDERALRRHELRHERSFNWRAGIECRNAALGRLDRRHAIAKRRPAKGPTDIIAMCNGADARCDRTLPHRPTSRHT